MEAPPSFNGTRPLIMHVFLHVSIGIVIHFCLKKPHNILARRQTYLQIFLMKYFYLLWPVRPSTNIFSIWSPANFMGFIAPPPSPPPHSKASDSAPPPSLPL